VERIVVEIVHSPRLRREIRSFENDEITVGRSFENDLIIADPFISPKHISIRVSEDGWFVEDLGSENGMFVQKLKRTVKNVHLHSGEEIILGKTRLRIFSSDHPLEPTKPLIQSSFFYRKIKQPVNMWSIILIMMLLYSIEAYLKTVRTVPIEKILSSSVGVLLVTILWAGFWGFVGGVVKHKSRFFLQLTITSIFFIILLPLNSFASHLGYLTSSPIIHSVTYMILFGILFTVLLIRNFSISTPITPKNRTVISSLISIILIATITFFYFAFKEDFDPEPQYYASLKPPYVKVVPGKPIDEFFSTSSKVFEFKKKDK